MIRKSINKKRFLTWLATQSALVSLLFLSSASGFEITDVMESRTAFSSLDTKAKLAHASSGEFSVLTYNIAGLPEIISSAKTKRAPSIAEIGRRLNAFDIVHVQEDFNYNRQLYQSGNLHPFRTATKGGVPFGDGLNTLSKYPVHEVRRISWNHCTGADCLTPKGFTYSRLEIAKNIFVDLYNVHANAYNHLQAAEARRNNIKQLSEFIRENSRGQAVIIMGDLNAHYSYYYDNVHQLLSDNDLKDAWLVLMNHEHLPQPVKELPDGKILKINSNSESIDKILFRGNDQIALYISKYNLESELFQNDKGTPLSDHHPVSLKFSWKLLDKKALESRLAAK